MLLMMLLMMKRLLLLLLLLLLLVMLPTVAMAHQKPLRELADLWPTWRVRGWWPCPTWRMRGWWPWAHGER
jgi:hypothetical protein